VGCKCAHGWWESPSAIGLTWSVAAMFQLGPRGRLENEFGLNIAALAELPGMTESALRDLRGTQSSSASLTNSPIR
jgi:hypothetical protein